MQTNTRQSFCAFLCLISAFSGIFPLCAQSTAPGSSTNAPASTNFMQANSLQDWSRQMKNRAGNVNPFSSTNSAKATKPKKVDELRIVGNKVIGDFAPGKVKFASSFLENGGVHFEQFTGEIQKSHVLCIVYYDPATQKTVVIGEPQESTAELLPPHEVIYRQAFKGIRADVLYHYSLSGLEQDIVLLERPQPPSAFGLSSECRLEVITEFVATNEPKQERKMLKLREQSAQHPALQEEDSNLNFGLYRIVQGRAFTLGGVPGANALGKVVPVGKAWQKVGQRSILIESIDVPALEDQLNQLPLADAKNAQNRPTFLAHNITLLPSTRSVAQIEKPIKVAALNSAPVRGLILDYLAVYNKLVNLDAAGGPKTGPAVVGQTSSDYWNATTTGGIMDYSLPNVLYANSGSSAISMLVHNGGGMWGQSVGDDMMNSYCYSGAGGTMTVTVTGLPNGLNDFLVYAHADNTGSGVEYASKVSISSGSYSVGPITPTSSYGWTVSSGWTEGKQYIRFRDVPVQNNGAVTVTIDSNPALGNYAILNGMQIITADSTMSSTASVPAGAKLLNVDVNGGSTASAKSGMAGAGRVNFDFWNSYGWYPNGYIANYLKTGLLWSDQTTAGVSIIADNIPGGWGLSTGDPMYDTYGYLWNGSAINTTLSGLPAGTADVYLYGHDESGSFERDVTFQVQSGNYTSAVAKPGASAGWHVSDGWHENSQYVVFRDVPITANQSLVITATEPVYSIPVINGLQVVSKVFDSDNDGLPDACVFRCNSDSDSENGRTVFRLKADSVPILFGQCSGG